MPAPTMSPDLQQLMGNYSDGVRELMTGARHKETIATLILSKGGVKIGIVGGAGLPDPAHLLEGSGKVHRHVAIQKPADLKRPALRSLVRTAYEAWKNR